MTPRLYWLTGDGGGAKIKRGCEIKGGFQKGGCTRHRHPPVYATVIKINFQFCEIKNIGHLAYFVHKHKIVLAELLKNILLKEEILVPRN